MGEAPNTKDKNLRLSEGKKTYKWKQDKENPLQYIQWGEKWKKKIKECWLAFMCLQDGAELTFILV